MKKGFNYILFLFAICLLWSCSSKKNTKASRFYHAFTSNYNIYFNGKTSFDESLDMMQKSYKESYTDMILMYPISAQPKNKETTGGSFDRAIEKGNKAVKLHSIKTKPPKKPGWRNNPKQRALQEQEEYNPFLKKCWLLVGQGQFYNADFLQASATFSYIARHYAHDPEMVAEAKLWQARCYTEMNWLYESEDILQKLNTNGIPKGNMNRYAAVNADYLIKNKQFEEAIPYLKTAIKGEKSKRQRTRMKYLLGQIYADQGLEGLAFQSFGEVARANPPYELELAARIRQTEVFTGADYQKMVKMLQRMAKSQKNTEFQDQVYYAIGNIYMSRQDTVKAIENYEIAIEESTQNGMDKAICWIRLGDIYFKMRDYMKAQPCFSGALSIIKKEYKEYERVAKLSAVLDELVVHVEAVHLQDSLQVLAKMPESERLAVIDKIIEKVKKEEEEAKELAAKEAFLADQASQGGLDRPGMETPTMNIPTAGSGSFYFYNPQTVAQGKTQFQRKWGKRVLEDDWRRRNKKISTFEDTNNDGVAATETIPQLDADGKPLPLDSLNRDESEMDSIADDPKTREFYLQQIPLTKEDIDASNLIIIDGLYNMAMIYKDKLEDLPLSVEAFDELERRFPDNEHLLESYYQVYLMSLRADDRVLALEVKNKLIAKFPESDYALAIANPNYEYNIRMMDRVQDSLYVSTYEQYLAENTRVVRANFKEVSEKYPLAKLLPKFMFLEALTYVQEGDPEGFKTALKALVEKYPTADVTELAGEMLKGVLRGRTMIKGGVKGLAFNIRFGVGEDGELSAADSARVFNGETNSPYRLILMYPTGSVDKNQLLFTVAAYNFANFMVKEFDLNIEENGPLSMLMIKGFVNIEEVIQYYKMIHGETGYGKVLGGTIAFVPISEDNYETLMRGKTLEEYIAFFEEHFGEKAPEIAARMKARILEDENAEEPVIDLPDTTTEEEKAEESVPEIEQPKETPVEPKKEEHVISKEQKTEEVTKETVEEKKEEILTPIVPEVKDTVPAEKELTLKEIEAIRKREAAEIEAKKEEARKEFEAKQKAEKELQEQKKQEQEELIKRQKAEEAALLKAKAENEKQLQLDKKAKQKQVEDERRAKQKAREELSKQKEREYKERQKQKEKERKEKERANKERLKQKEKERRETLKAKEAAAKKR